MRLRLESLAERQRAAARRLVEAMQPVHAVFDGLAEAFRQTGEQLRSFFDELARIGMGAAAEPADPRERALAARRNRNAGPQQRRCPPRAIGRPFTAGR